MSLRTATRTSGHLVEAEAEGKAGVHLQTNGNHKPGSGMKFNSQLNVLIALGMVALFYFASSVILPIIIAGVFAMVLKPFVLLLGRWHLPRPLATLLILAIFFGAISAGFVELSQPALKWINDAPQSLAKLRQRFEKQYAAEKVRKAVDAMNLMGASNETTEQKPAVAIKDNHTTSAALTWTGGLLGGILETVVLLYMFLVLGDEYLERILDGSKDTKEKKHILKISQEVQKTISKYLFTVSYINVSLGILVGGGLYFMGLPNAALWGLVATLLNYIPYFGPIVGIIVVGLVGLLSGGPVSGAFFPAAWYLLLHVAEADFITPVLLGRQFTVSPIAIFISLLFWTWLWGPLGALLAMPILMSLKVICRDLPGLSAVTKFL